MATKLSDILNKESTGIMFPFSSSTSSTGVAPVSTTQQVYNTATNGIMTVQGKQYTGPDAIINYGSKEEGYPRNLKQIEKGMLPQFDESKLPDVGKGTVETGTPTAPVTPPTEEVKTPEPVVDPCPTGFKLINGVCQKIQQGGNDRPAPKGKTVTNGIIEGYTRAALTPSPFSTGGLNSNEMMALEKKYGVGVSKQIGLIDQQFNRGTQVKHVKEKINDPETGKLIEVDAKNPDGTIKVENVIAISPTAEQALKEISPFTGLIDAISSGKLVEDGKEALNNIAGGLINVITGNIKTDNKKIKVTEEPKKEAPETKINFGELSKNFGVLQSSLLDTTSQLTSIQENMLNMMKGRGTDTVELAKLKKQEKKLKAKKDREQKAVTVAQAEIDKFVEERVTAPESYKIETKDDGKTARERINDRKAALEKNKERFAKTSDGRTNYKEGVGFTKGR